MSRGRRVVARAGVGAAAGVGWVLAGYPLSLLLARPRPARCDARLRPSVSVVICATGAAAPLERKLRALRHDGYPLERLEVIVAADGDADLVGGALRAWPDAVIDYRPVRRGKAVALADALSRARGELVVFTDADNVLDPDALAAAVRWFADPEVWAVVGRRGESGSAYDRYEDLVRRMESRSGSVAAANGEFLAVRRARLRAAPAVVINDDLHTLMDILARGGRAVYEPAAGGVEPALAAGPEVERRARISAGRVALAAELRGLPPQAAWRLVNHKFARLAVPPLGLVALAGLPAARHPLARALAALELAAIVTGLLHLAGRPLPGGALGRLSAACGQGVTGAVAGVLGILRAVRGRQPATWRAVR